MKKKVLALFLAMIMVVGLVACGGGGTAEAPVETEAKTDDPNVLEIGDLKAAYKGFRIVTDSDDETAIAIYLDFTNNSEEATSIDWAMYPEVTQNGEAMQYAVVFVDEESYDTLDEDSGKEAQPGETIEIIWTYKLADAEAPITISCSDLMEEYTDELTIDPTGKQMGEEAEAPSGETEEPKKQVGYAFSDSIASSYVGDWHGMAEFYDCTGDYSDEDGLQCEIVARLIFDEDGYCTPYLRLCLDQPEDENFVIESLDYDEEYDCMLINGTLHGKTIDPVESFIELEGETLYIGAEYDDGSGDVFHVLGCLRRLDDQWDYENDYPYLSQEGVDFYMGKSFEEIVELYGYDTSLLPKLSGSAPVSEAPAAAAGTVELQQLKDWKAWLDEVNCYETEYYTPTYEECVEAMDGIEPAPRDEDEWDDEYRYYKWTTADEMDHIILTVKPTDDGSGWRYHSISWSSGVNG